MKKIKDFTGMVFGKLTAVEFDHKDSRSQSFWKCKCECGTEKVIRASSLVHGESTSCGCSRNAAASARMRNIAREKRIEAVRTRENGF